MTSIFRVRTAFQRLQPVVRQTAVARQGHALHGYRVLFIRFSNIIQVYLLRTSLVLLCRKLNLADISSWPFYKKSLWFPEF